MKSFSNASLALLLFLAATALAQQPNPGSHAPYPQADSGYVTDLAGMLSATEEEQIERWLWQVENETQVEIIVVTINAMADYPGTANTSIEAFAAGLFDRYGIGNMPANDGILLLVAGADRRARIDLGGGYGRSRDADAGHIMNTVILPRFRKDDYAGGIRAGTEALIEEFAGMRVGFPWAILAAGTAALVSLLVGISLIRSGKRGWGYVFIGLAILLVLFTLYMAVRLARRLPDSHSSSWSAGGIGGFGGGSSGGGGASGGW